MATNPEYHVRMYKKDGDSFLTVFPINKTADVLLETDLTNKKARKKL